MDEDGTGERKEIFNIVGTKVNIGSKSPKKDIDGKSRLQVSTKKSWKRSDPKSYINNLI